MVIIQGNGLVNDVKVESPTMIRFGDTTWDEFFISYNTATKGIKIINKGYEPLVMLKFFGFDCNLDMPDKK